MKANFKRSLPWIRLIQYLRTYKRLFWSQTSKKKKNLLQFSPTPLSSTFHSHTQSSQMNSRSSKPMHCSTHSPCPHPPHPPLTPQMLLLHYRPAKLPNFQSASQMLPAFLEVFYKQHDPVCAFQFPTLAPVIFLDLSVLLESRHTTKKPKLKAEPLAIWPWPSQTTQFS